MPVPTMQTDQPQTELQKAFAERAYLVSLSYDAANNKGVWKKRGGATQVQQWMILDLLEDAKKRVEALKKGAVN